MLASTYLQAKATCDQVSALDAILDKELMLETMQHVRGKTFQFSDFAFGALNQLRFHLRCLVQVTFDSAQNAFGEDFFRETQQCAN